MVATAAPSHPDDIHRITYPTRPEHVGVKVNIWSGNFDMPWERRRSTKIDDVTINVRHSAGPPVLTFIRSVPSTLCLCSVFAHRTPIACPRSSPAARGLAAKLSGCNSLPSRRGAAGTGLCRAEQNIYVRGMFAGAAAFRFEALTFVVVLPGR